MGLWMNVSAYTLANRQPLAGHPPKTVGALRSTITTGNVAEMDLSVYSVAHLQNLQQMLNQFEAESITDSRFVRQRLADEVSSRTLKHKQTYVRGTTPAERAGRRKNARHPATAAEEASFPTITCPHCNTPLVPVANPDGLRIIGCKQCRYSRILEGLNG